MNPLLTRALCLLPIVATAAVAQDGHDYPTQARVEYVYECMNEHGGINYDTMYACSCEIDRIADALSYEEYVTADTFTRGRGAAGERAEVLREGGSAEAKRAELERVEKKAVASCEVATTAPKQGDAGKSSSKGDK